MTVCVVTERAIKRICFSKCQLDLISFVDIHFTTKTVYITHFIQYIVKIRFGYKHWGSLMLATTNVIRMVGKEINNSCTCTILRTSLGPSVLWSYSIQALLPVIEILVTPFSPSRACWNASMATLLCKSSI